MDIYTQNSESRDRSRLPPAMGDIKLNRFFRHGADTNEADDETNNECEDNDRIFVISNEHYIPPRRISHTYDSVTPIEQQAQFYVVEIEPQRVDR